MGKEASGTCSAEYKIRYITEHLCATLVIVVKIKLPNPAKNQTLGYPVSVQSHY
jgi:hypothetical protein